MLDKFALKELSPLTIFVWGVYTVFVLALNIYNPNVNLPLTSLKLFPLITLVLLIVALILILRDFVKLSKKEKKG